MVKGEGEEEDEEQQCNYYLYLAAMVPFLLVPLNNYRAVKEKKKGE